MWKMASVVVFFWEKKKGGKKLDLASNVMAKKSKVQGENPLGELCFFCPIARFWRARGSSWLEAHGRE